MPLYVANYSRLVCTFFCFYWPVIVWVVVANLWKLFRVAVFKELDVNILINFYGNDHSFRFYVVFL